MLLPRGCEYSTPAQNTLPCLLTSRVPTRCQLQTFRNIFFLIEELPRLALVIAQLLAVANLLAIHQELAFY